MKEFLGQYWKHKDVPKKDCYWMLSTWYLYDIYMRWCALCIVESVDVNVTPDKRQIFMENEKILLATIKVSILLRGNFFLLATIKHRMLLLCWPLISHLHVLVFFADFPGQDLWTYCVIISISHFYGQRVPNEVVLSQWPIRYK